LELCVFFYKIQKQAFFFSAIQNLNYVKKNTIHQKKKQKKNEIQPKMSHTSLLKFQDFNTNITMCKENLDYYIKQIHNKNLIDKIEIRSFKENYYCSTTRYRIVSTIFFKDGMIVKYIQEYNDGFRPYSSTKRYYMFI
jgi:hypothetical protein